MTLKLVNFTFNQSFQEFARDSGANCDCRKKDQAMQYPRGHETTCEVSQAYVAWRKAGQDLCARLRPFGDGEKVRVEA